MLGAGREDLRHSIGGMRPVAGRLATALLAGLDRSFSVVDTYTGRGFGDNCTAARRWKLLAWQKRRKPRQ
jgi:hypothetical protein